MYCDYKTPWRRRNNEGTWTVSVRVSEGDYTQDRFDLRGVLLTGKDYERYRGIAEGQISFPSMSEVELVGQLNLRLLKYAVGRAPIPGQSFGPTRPQPQSVPALGDKIRDRA